MSDFIARVIAKLWLLWFACRFRGRFRRLGAKAQMFRPYRIDGAANIELGAESSLQRGSWLYCVGIDGIPASLRIGRGCELGYNNHITAVREVVIGDHVLTANNVYISDNLHGYEDISRPILQQPVRFKNAVTIGDGSWIGENACVIGARIGRQCVIGANAVVTSDIPDYSVAVGIPAVVIRRYDVERREWVEVRA
jgi:acetyltransferase-like isoleucine patch superfamily enzyme